MTYWPEELYSVEDHVGLEDLVYEFKQDGEAPYGVLDEATELLAEYNLDSKENVAKCFAEYIEDYRRSLPSSNYFLDAVQQEVTDLINDVVWEFPFEDNTPYGTLEGKVDRAVQTLADHIVGEEWFGAIGGDPEYNELDSDLADLADAISLGYAPEYPTRGDEDDAKVTKQILRKLERELVPELTKGVFGKEEWAELESDIQEAHGVGKESAMYKAKEIAADEYQDLFYDNATVQRFMREEAVSSDIDAESLAEYVMKQLKFPDKFWDVVFKMAQKYTSRDTRQRGMDF